MALSEVWNATENEQAEIRSVPFLYILLSSFFSPFLYLASKFRSAVWLQNYVWVSESPHSVLNSWFVLMISFSPSQLLSTFVLLLALLFLFTLFIILCTSFKKPLCYLFRKLVSISISPVSIHANIWVAPSFSPSRGCVMAYSFQKRYNLVTVFKYDPMLI
jgi:hypothetical protein